MIGGTVRYGRNPQPVETVGVLGVSFVLTRFLESMLFQVASTDASTYALLAALVLAVAAVATLLPAVRALRVEPASALRSD